MNPELIKMLAGSLLRHGLTALSAYLVSHDLLAAEHSASFVTDLTTYLGDALPAIIALLWSAIQKSDTHDAITR